MDRVEEEFVRVAVKFGDLKNRRGLFRQRLQKIGVLFGEHSIHAIDGFKSADDLRLGGPELLSELNRLCDERNGDQ